MKKAMVPLIVALVLGLAAAIMAYNVMSKRPVAAHTEQAGTRMVVAKRPIPPGHSISPDDLGVMSIEGRKSPEGTFSSPEELLGRVAAMPIDENQPVLQSMLANPRAGTGLEALLPDGTRAITIDVNEVSGVAGLLNPGCHVDLLTSLHEGNAGSLITRTLVQDVKVVAVGQSMSPAPAPDGQVARSVTLVVTPKQAEMIELASNVGRPRLILRSGADSNLVEMGGVSLSQLEGDNLPAISQSAQPTDRHYVEIIRGGVESVVPLPTALSSAQSANGSSVAGGKIDTAPIAPQ
ncbi:MAG TPA: Flp pilus assembly protein CpaB [Tepidisphaeraceae bacterium]|nr:Flp pilus assembly protein CpaB [Tepidisphaeraceae bacterium]